MAMAFVQNLLASLRFNQKGKFLEKHYITIRYPDDEQGCSFDEVIGKKSEKEVLSDALHFFKIIQNHVINDTDFPNVMPNSHFLVAGEPGSGKSTLIKAIAKSSGTPLISVNCQTFMAFPKKIKQLVNTIFDYTDMCLLGCVIDFNSFGAILSLTPELQSIFYNEFFKRATQSENTVIFLSATNGEFKLPASFCTDSLFNAKKIIQVMPPTVDERIEFFDYFIKKFDVECDETVDIKQLAKNTLGMNPNEIKYVVKETVLYAKRNGHSNVTSKDFNDVILTVSAGEKYDKLSEKEKLATAYHEAGHVIAAYYSNPDYILGRVEITPRSESLGLTLEDYGEDKKTNFKSDMHKEIIYTLGGMAAELTVYGENSSGVIGDLSTANTIVYLMFSAMGMDKDLGPIALDDDFGFCSTFIYNLVEKKAQQYLKDTLTETMSIIQKHRTQLDALARALVDSEVLYGNEIKDIIESA